MDCFTITLHGVDTQEAKQTIKHFLMKSFRNKKWKEHAFEKDEDIPIDIIFGMLWKKRKSVCLKLTTRAKEKVDKVKWLIEKMGDSIDVSEEITLTKPVKDDAAECNLDRFKMKKGEKQWNTLEHNGPYFKHLVDPYKPHGAKLIYDGETFSLTPDEEEVATFFARRIITEETSATKYLDNKTFIGNFFTDFKKYMTAEHRKKWKVFDKFDFQHIVDKIKENKEKEVERKKHEKEEDNDAYKEMAHLERIKKAEQKLDYSFAYVNGVKRTIRNAAVEMPGLYVGAGKNMTNKGKVKWRVLPSDVIINASKGDAPAPPKGHKWGEVVVDNTKKWLAKYKDTVTGTLKYILLTESSDLLKFEKARKLNKFIDVVDNQMNTLLHSSSERDRQIGTVLYLVKEFGLRIGSDDANDMEDEDQDVVGASSLKVKYVIPKKTKGKIELKFRGKDSVLYHQTIHVNDVVYDNIVNFIKGKKDNARLFDKINSDDVNKYLKSIDKDFSAKVFRTRLASSMMFEGLNKLTKKSTKSLSTKDKIALFMTVNKTIAEKLNHKKTLTQKQKDTLIEKQEEIDALKDELEEEENESKRKKLEKSIASKEEALSAKEFNKELALETSRKNYIDPRVIKSWAEKVELDIKPESEDAVFKPTVYSKALITHFEWALEDEEVTDEWNYKDTELDCVVGDELEPYTEEEARSKKSVASSEGKSKKSAASTEANPKPKPKKSTEVKPKPKKSTEAKPKKPTEAKPDASIDGKHRIRIVDYTDKSFAVFGDTKPWKDAFLLLNGKFNPKLKEDGNESAGWIFSKKKRDLVLACIKDPAMFEKKEEKLQKCIEKVMTDFDLTEGIVQYILKDLQI